MIEKKLSEKAYRLWFAVLWTWVVCCMLPVLLLLLVPDCRIAVIVIEAILLITGILIQLYIKAYWRCFRFAYDDRELHVWKGVWWQKQVLIPFSRITNINIVQGPWQRNGKMATLKFETAGGSGNQASPEAMLFSQEDYESLRDDLLKRIVPMRGMVAGDGTSESDVTMSDDFQGRMIEILSRIEKNTRPTE